MSFLFQGVLMGSLFIFIGCQKKQFPAPVTEDSTPVAVEAPVPEAKPEVAEVEVAAELSPEIEKGRRLYLANCLQCHNRDPNIKGSIGPEMIDAPLEVMVSKVMTGKYPDPLPPGFVPKRKTRAMRPIPKLKEDIPAIWAYVQSVKKK
jgi:mono/diheme cytochrome c family protein